MDKKQRAQIEVQEIQLKHKTKKFTVRLVKHWRVCPGVLQSLMLGDIQNTIGEDPEQSALAWPFFEQGAGLDKHWR